MLGVESYGSDDNDSGDEISVKPTAPAEPISKSSATSSSLSLPPPKTKKAPKKIAIGLPTLSTNDDAEDNQDSQPPTKRPRLETGSGKSSLFSMLPAPKQAAPPPKAAAAPERVLGGGRGPGLVFNAARSAVPTSDAITGPTEDEEDQSTSKEAPTLTPAAGPSTAFMPPSLKKGRPNVSLEETRKTVLQAKAVAPPAAPAVDFFSIGSTVPRPKLDTAPQLVVPPIVKPPTSSAPVSAAPKIDDFTPPEPTPNDEYPGYYRLPSGAWAQYDQTYYMTFYNKWKKEYDSHIRALEKGKARGFEEAQEEDLQEVDAAEAMEKARVEVKEREDRKALTSGAKNEGDLAAPKMNVKGAQLGRVARTRHQLSTLLTEAYENREVLEERIAQARRNRKEAGNKYGF